MPTHAFEAYETLCAAERLKRLLQSDYEPPTEPEPMRPELEVMHELQLYLADEEYRHQQAHAGVRPHTNETAALAMSSAIHSTVLLRDQLEALLTRVDLLEGALKAEQTMRRLEADAHSERLAAIGRLAAPKSEAA